MLTIEELDKLYSFLFQKWNNNSVIIEHILIKNNYSFNKEIRYQENL